MAIFTPRPFARMMMPGLLKEGLSNKTIWRRLRGMGFGYRDAIMYQDINEFRGFLKKQFLFIGFDTSLIPTRDMMVETRLRRATNYRVFGEANIYNPWTGESETRTISMYSDVMYSLDEFDEMYRTELEEGEFKDSDDVPSEFIEDVKFMAVEHNEGWEY